MVDDFHFSMSLKTLLKSGPLGEFLIAEEGTIQAENRGTSIPKPKSAYW